MKYILSLFILATLLNVSHGANNLDLAYKREFIFLNSQLKELNTQKTQITKKYKQSVIEVKKSLDQLQENLISLNASNENISERLFKIEQSAERGEENRVILANTLKQAFNSLSLKSEDTPKITEVLKLGIAELSRSSMTTKKGGLFYLANGEQVKADVLKIGNIASIGSYQSKYYLLAPAGNDQLKVWKEAPNGKAFFEGHVKKAEPLFIYESLRNAATKKSGQSLYQFIAAGGIIGWVIVGLGIFAFLLCVLRAINLYFYSNETTYIDANCNLVNIEHTTRSLESFKSRYQIKELILKVLRMSDSSKDLLNDVIDEGMINEHKEIDRFGAIILVFAAVAPLLGLLGTVTGMISTFDIITEYGTGDPKLLSQGISEALITTELGLIVAIPSLLFGNMLSSWGRNIKMTLDKLVLKLSNEI